MAIPKVCGIETEYGIFLRGPVSDAVSNPVAASSMLINAYLAANNRKVGWDFQDEHPGTDARGFSVDDLLALPLARFPTGPLMSRAHELRANVTAYDASYIALAEGLACTLLTADARLARAPLVRCDIEIFQL